jgi:AraC family transcriptional regulator
MKSKEDLISHESEYYICLPSTTAKSTYFYPLCVGKFIYEPGYHLYRYSYDSFLLMYIASGELTAESEGQSFTAVKGDFVLINCYKPHAYYSEVGWESIWCHFDGPVAAEYFRLIKEKHGNVFRISNPYAVISKLELIYDSCTWAGENKEPLLSKQLTDILTAILTTEDPEGKGKGKEQADSGDLIDEAVAYMNEHFAEKITVKGLAEEVALSQYHFIRLFKKRMGLTPYQYLVSLRLNAAKFLLRTSKASVKEICFSTGFSGESTFCSTFKKNIGVSPEQYRRQNEN